MRITRLTVERLRCLSAVDLRPGPGLNFIIGPNGSGKTSLLEAVHLLAYGRSFRGRVRDGLIRSGQESLEVFAEWDESPMAGQRKVGLRHNGQTWTGRLDGDTVDQLGELCAALAAVTFEPGSHALVSGTSDARRRYLDWGLFHVEPDFLPLWRRYARALKQRNALLKHRRGGDELDLWDAELASAGEPLQARRQRYVERLQPRLAALSEELQPELGACALQLKPGWRREELSLADALLLARDRDLAAGFTSLGPHRADWRIEHAARPRQEALSRGQGKLAALACLLAQADDFALERGHWPVLLLDDLASELDAHHQRRLLERLMASNVQAFITATQQPVSIADENFEMFHVEHGNVGISLS